MTRIHYGAIGQGVNVILDRIRQLLKGASRKISPSDTALEQGITTNCHCVIDKPEKDASGAVAGHMSHLHFPPDDPDALAMLQP